MKEKEQKQLVPLSIALDEHLEHQFRLSDELAIVAFPKKKGQKTKSALQHPQMERCKLGWQDAPFAMLCVSVELEVPVT